MMTKLCMLALIATGCAKTDSSDLLTTGIYADLSAHATGAGSTTVYATLYVGSPINLNFVELSGNDQLIASHGSEHKAMSQTELLNLVSHSAVFATDDEATQLSIAFTRSVDQGAPLSTMTLPAKLTLGATPTTSSRAAALTVTWSPAGSADAMAWDAIGPCIVNAHGAITGDPGSVTLPAGMLQKPQGQNVPDSCMVSFTLSRSRPGVLDTHYGKGGTVTGSQDRGAMWMSTP
jgi:hypothetical protein